MQGCVVEWVLPILNKQTYKAFDVASRERRLHHGKEGEGRRTSAANFRSCNPRKIPSDSTKMTKITDKIVDFVVLDDQPLSCSKRRILSLNWAFGATLTIARSQIHLRTCSWTTRQWGNTFHVKDVLYISIGVWLYFSLKWKTVLWRQRPIQASMYDLWGAAKRFCSF